MNNELIIIRGIPGSGKSTLAKNRWPGYEHYEADMYFMKDGEYQFVPSKIKDAHAWCQDSVRKALKSGDSVVVSNTFTQLWEMKSYIITAKEMGIPYTIVKCVGEFENVHGVPPEALKRMKDRWEDHPNEKVEKL